MKKTLLVALIATAGFANANLFVNGGFASGTASFQTGAGNGVGGANTSAIDGANFGFNALQGSFRAADDFTVGAGGWNLSDLTVYSYQTGGGTTNTITGMTVALYNTMPVTGADTPTFGSLTTNILTSSVDTGINRVTSTTLTDANRRIFAATGNLAGINLSAGTWWLAVSLTGSTSFSGPWVVPITPNTGQIGGAFMQAAGTAAYAATTDTINGAVVNTNMAFTLNYTPVPEPASMAALGLGALALIRRRRNKKA